MMMTELTRSLSLNQRLALAAFGLGFVALFAGSPYHGADATVNTKELALIVERQADQVDVQALADWIIQGKSDFRVVDLRAEKAYAEYHIPPAENIPVTGLEHSSLMHNEKVILYSDDGTRAAQAWMLLRAKGYKGVYMLNGGLDEWKARILFPRIPDNPTSAQAIEFARVKEVSRYFGGAPQSGAADTAAARKVAMPRLEMPAAGAGGAGAPKKKKKEGC